MVLPESIKEAIGTMDAQRILGDNHSFIELVDHMGNEKDVCRSARVSHAKDEEETTPAKDANLIRYLLNMGHWSPFEHVSMTWYVGAPIFVTRQWMRHKSWSFNEVSGRYSELPDAYYLPEKFRGQDPGNKQGSIEGSSHEWMMARDEMEQAMWHGAYAYQQALRTGVAKEVARMCLPLSTYTRLYASCTLRSLLHFLKDRCAPEAQLEIRLYAEAMREMASRLWPETISNYLGYTHHANHEG